MMQQIDRVGLLAAISALVFLAAAPGWAGSDKEYDPAIDPADFVLTIDNPYFPLIPGTTFVYEADTDEGPLREELAVTSETRMILGVTATVVRHSEWIDGELEEVTDDWYAQDQEGNVWYFGEYVTEYVGGMPDGHEGSWEAGVAGALPGIIMPAEPESGQSYHQEFQEGVAEDMARTLRTNDTVSVAYGTFTDVLVTKEWSPLEPGAIEHKYYARGVGLVLVEELHGGTVRVELIDVQ